MDRNKGLHQRYSFSRRNFIKLGIVGTLSLVIEPESILGFSTSGVGIPLRLQETLIDYEEMKALIPIAFESETVPTYLPVIRNGMGEQDSVDLTTFMYELEQNGHIKMLRDNEPIMIWNELTGWTTPQLETLHSRILLDLDCSDFAKKQEGQRGFAYSLIPIELEEHLLEMLPPEDTQLLQTTYFIASRGSSNSPLLKTFNGKESIDNALITAFAMIRYKTLEPTDAQLFQTQDDLIANVLDPITSTRGEWDLRKRVTLIFTNNGEGNPPYYVNRQDLRKNFAQLVGGHLTLYSSQPHLGIALFQNVSELLNLFVVENVFVEPPTREQFRDLVIPPLMAALLPETQRYYIVPLIAGRILGRRDKTITYRNLGYLE